MIESQLMNEGAETCGSLMDETRLPGADESCPGNPVSLLLEIQRDMAIGLLSCVDLPGCLGLLLDSAMRLPGFDCGGIYGCDGRTGDLRLISHRGLSPGFVERSSYYPADSPQARLLREGRLIYAKRSDLPQEVAAAIRSEGLEALAIVPVMDGSRLVAAINVSSHVHHRIGQDSRVALESLVAQVEVAMFSMNEREARRLAENQLRMALDGAELGTCLADFETGEFSANAKALELHGLPPDAKLNAQAAILPVHPDDRARLSDALRRTFEAGEAFSCEYRVADASQGERWLASKGRLFEERGGRRIHGIVRDITASKLAEKALIESRDRLEARVAERTNELETLIGDLREESTRLELALSASQAGVCSWDVGSGEMTCDERFRELFGFEGGARITCEQLLERMLPEDRQALQAMIAAIDLPGFGDQWNQELRIVHPDLGERWISRLGRVERDSRGRALRVVGISFDITERKRTEESLRVSELKYRNLHESMSDAIVGVDLGGRIIESNRAFQEMMGYTAEELRHLSYYDITPERWHSMEAEMAVSEVFFSRGFSDLYEKEYRRKDGSVFPVELRAFLIRDAAGEPVLIWAIIRDITERKQAEQSILKWNQNLERRVAERTVELVQSEARFRQLTEATFEGVAISEAGVLIDGNPQLARIYQCELADMIGRPVLDFIAPESRDLVARRIRDGRETIYECLGLRQDGSKFTQEVHASTRVWQGREIRVTAVRDLTETKQAAARFQALQTELEHAQRLGLVSEVSAGIVHQIGQPLCAMGANAAVALSLLRRRDASSAEVLEIVEDIEADIVRIRDAVVHLRALVNPAHASHVRIDFNELISDVIGLVSQEAARRLIDLEVDLRGGLPPIEGDSVQLSQVVLNLIHNAFDACEDGSQVRRCVQVTTCPADGGGVRLEVRDSGPGIAPAAMAGLFAPFFTTKREGLGMGLRLCHTIVRAHGGTIEGANHPDRPGALFRVILPVTPDIIHANM